MSTKILIVDDEPATVDMISTFMEMMGYEWSSANSGMEGWTMLQVDKPDVLILDLMMPDIQGFEFCAQMRANESYANIPVLIVSARTDPEAIQQAYDVGADGYITKPFNLEELLSEVKRLSVNE